MAEENKQENEDMMILKDVRCSFVHLFKKPIINGEEGSHGSTLLLEPDRHEAYITALQLRIKELHTDILKVKKMPSEKICLRDGDESVRSEYEGYQVLSANRKGKPVVIANDGRSVITEPDECAIYSGCYVNVKIRLWAQNNNWGKRVNAELISIQFSRDGEPLDGSHVSVDDAIAGFDEVEVADEFLGV